MIRKNNHMITCHFLFLLLPLPLPSATAQLYDAIPMSSEPAIRKNLAIAFIALISAFFLLGLFSFYTRQCTEGRFGRGPGNFPASQRGGGGMLWRTSRGLDATLIATFPTIAYSKIKGLKIGKSSLECAVCLNEFENKDTLRLIPKCNHVFHSVCIDSWFVSHSTCPVCRANLIPKAGDGTSPATNLDSGSGSEGPEQPEQPGQPENQVSILVVEDRQAREEETTETNAIRPSPIANRSPPPPARPTGWRLTGMFQRSRSTGHERFTLRLPEEVRSQLLNSTLYRTRSWAELPREPSSRRGYRTEGGENGRGKNFLDRTLSVPAPFFGRPGTGGTLKAAEGAEDDTGERSFARLTPKGVGPSTAAV